jgi:ribulose-5-phosphate 4-epimerase/fuculose-1-phosphate aldolase
VLDPTGRYISGDAPTKEAVLHTVMYDRRPNAGAVVHLHSLHSVAVSCLHGLDAANVLPPLTAYSVMRVGALALAPYFPPGDVRLADAVGALAGRHHAILLANHGPVVAGSSLAAASDAIEELEETARLFLLLRNDKVRMLTPDEVAEVQRLYPVR